MRPYGSYLKQKTVPRDQRTEKNSSGVTGRRTSLVTQMVKNPPAMQEIQVRLLGQEDSLGEGNGYPL